MQIDGLIPAIVQEYTSGRVLMLAYVNQKSYDFMQTHGETCFWSRSRNELWHKGATSGDIQKIRHMAFDCDNDTLLIQVDQQGKGACHTGAYSCFGDEHGAFHILTTVSEEIGDRAVNPQENSYTNYLLGHGVDKICKKIGEEATETILAAKNNDAENLTDEISDLAYHLLVLMHTQNVSVADVTRNMSARHGVKGNRKPGLKD